METCLPITEVKRAQEYSKKALSKLWDENKRYLNPQEYPVDLSLLGQQT